MTTPRKTGRPGKLTRQLLDDVVKRVETGVSVEVAAASCGVSAGTFYRWRAEGQDDIEADRKTLQREFRERTDVARAVAEATHVAVIGRAARAGDWRASAFYLERARPERWSKHETITANVRSVPELDADIARLIDGDVVEVRELSA